MCEVLVLPSLAKTAGCFGKALRKKIASLQKSGPWSTTGDPHVRPGPGPLAGSPSLSSLFAHLRSRALAGDLLWTNASILYDQNCGHDGEVERYAAWGMF
jgi:hypothetical protein